MEKKEQKKKFKTSFEKIRKQVNEFDPCGFIKLGAPVDEYDCLTVQLIKYLYDKKTTEEIKKFILHEIEDHFGIPDIQTLKEPYKTNFYNNLDKLINNLKQTF